MRIISVIDSHTGGESTRVIVAGGPDLGSGSAAERLEQFRTHNDRFRSAVVNEPRGSDVLVGALLFESTTLGCDFGVIFFNNVGYLGMCGRGTIGVIVSLVHLGRIRPGITRLETPAGIVAAELHADGTVSVENVPIAHSRDDVVFVLDIGFFEEQPALPGQTLPNSRIRTPFSTHCFGRLQISQ